MLLQPRNFISKKKQKDRRFRQFRLNFNLHYGNFGLLILRPIQLTGEQIHRLKLFLKRSTKKGDKTRRCMWFFAFPHLPLSKKPVGLRMGKGKGKLQCWFTNIRGGVILIEFKNLRRGRALYFMRQLQFKLGIPVKFFSKQVNVFPLPLTSRKSFAYKTFW